MFFADVDKNGPFKVCRRGVLLLLRTSRPSDGEAAPAADLDEALLALLAEAFEGLREVLQNAAHLRGAPSVTRIEILRRIC